MQQLAGKLIAVEGIDQAGNYNAAISGQTFTQRVPVKGRQQPRPIAAQVVY